MIIAPHITCGGTCARAIAFYESVFPIESKSITTLGDSPLAAMFPVTPENESFVYHASLRFACGTTITMGDSITLLLTPDNPGFYMQPIYDIYGLTVFEINSIYTQFMDIGSVANAQLGPKDEYALFASFIDPFGVCWNLYCDKNGDTQSHL